MTLNVTVTFFYPKKSDGDTWLHLLGIHLSVTHIAIFLAGSARENKLYHLVAMP